MRMLPGTPLSIEAATIAASRMARRQVIYEKPASGGRVSVSPLFGPERRGVAISVKF